MDNVQLYYNGKLLYPPSLLRMETPEEKMQRISDDINVRYADAFKALAKSERQDRENELLFGFERNCYGPLSMS